MEEMYGDSFPSLWSGWCQAYRVEPGDISEYFNDDPVSGLFLRESWRYLCWRPSQHLRRDPRDPWHEGRDGGRGTRPPPGGEHQELTEGDLAGGETQLALKVQQGIQHDDTRLYNQDVGK